MKKLRRNRGLPSLSRSHWLHVMRDPSRSAWALSGRGCATRRSLLESVSCFMDVMVSEMCLVTHKVGMDTENGFFLRTWSAIAGIMKVTVDRVKQCFMFCKDRGWITSEQPKELNDDGSWVCLASIKRVTNKYFQDLGLVDAMLAARKSALKLVCDRAEVYQKPVAFILTPISLLRKIKKTLTTSWAAYFKAYYKLPTTPFDRL